MIAISSWTDKRSWIYLIFSRISLFARKDLILTIPWLGLLWKYFGQRLRFVAEALPLLGLLVVVFSVFLQGFDFSQEH